MYCHDRGKERQIVGFNIDRGKERQIIGFNIDLIAYFSLFFRLSSFPYFYIRVVDVQFY